MPTKTKSSYNTVKKPIAENKKALEFLKELGISKPDIYAEINEFILPKYAEDNIDINDDEYFEDIEKLLIALLKDSSEKRTTLISDLAELPIINSVNPETDENYLMKPGNVYLNSNDLRIYFDGYDGAFFINNNLYKKFGQKKFENFALDIGCNNTPKHIEIECELSWEDKSKLRNGGAYSYERYTKDYDLDGLENFLKNLNIEKSVLFWDLVLKSVSEFDGWNKSKFFNGTYCWYYYSERLQDFDAKFLKVIKSENWLFDKNGNQVKPSSISISELALDYQRDDENIDVLVESLGFQLDAIKQIERVTGKHVILMSDEEEKTEQVDNTDDWEPDVLPDEIDTTSEEITIEQITREDLRDQMISGDLQDNGSKEHLNNDTNEDGEGKIRRKQIGRWGEEYVYYHFQNKKYTNLNNYEETDLGFIGFDDSGNKIEVKWLNKNKDIGKGYDFVLLENDVETEYIEVKTTTKSSMTLHQITGTQWEFARTLFLDFEGEKYKIYVVKNANSYDARIRFISNPIKLWKDGKLYAHPINFRL